MSDDLHSAESSPLFRKAAKVVAVAAWCCATLAAMAMTFDVMQAKAGDAPEPWLVVALLAIGLACDFWVGVGPVLIVTAHRWGLRVFAWLSGAGLVLALALTFSNKIDFWGGRADARQDTAQRVELARGVDTLAADRALLEANPGARPLAVVEAARAGVARELANLRERPTTFRTRIAGLETQLTALETEAALVAQVEAARARVVAAASVAPDALPATSRVTHEHLARDRWIAGALNGLGFAAVTPALVEAWVNGLFAVFHELLCLTGLTLGTLAQPPLAIRREALAKVARLTAVRKAELESQVEVERLQGQVEVAALRARADLARERRQIERELAEALVDEADARDGGREPWTPPNARDEADLVARPLAPEPVPEPDLKPRRPGLFARVFGERVFGARGDGWRMFAREEVGRRPPPRPPANSDDELPRLSGRALPAPDLAATPVDVTDVGPHDTDLFEPEDPLHAERQRLAEQIAALELQAAQLRAAREARRDRSLPSPDAVSGALDEDAA